MTATQVILRAAARQDVDDAVAHYAEKAGTDVALGFIDALEGALRHIALNPASGSPRYGHELNLEGLRSWAFKSHPQIVFYMEGSGRIDVWRVLHGQRDIPAWLSERER
ncbi:MAG: type II toxin-antitoxin system RelE/ParE family toxin [Gemmatimonadetes bacterium]|nr:type II toxin-antitoxin system RelE/ParE family toxin [Gemmatimonadota bacterium]MYH51490.1 type II toxin-antitoxin system RelE/ParE family toxin [Gemmatimonadota bacterium]MYK65492.1 type II toxin-antitoxin system RelE/ParE family toxin [Gemmatimonadota bacterium]